MRGTFIIELQGELDMLAYLELGPRVQALACPAAHDVVVDLRAVTFLDASGIRLLLAVREHVAPQGDELRLVRGIPRVWKVLRIVRVDHAFTVLDALPPILLGGAAALRDERTSA
ncbi:MULTISPECIES: STAS domain-containing protein [unclassified Streptomyces]|uniref:STAS domain-containing protein n=1 Tax=Streptomyces sp. NBC_00060 TaxID=2975636 RepID=A0AAU2GY63_9ACTN